MNYVNEKPLLNNDLITVENPTNLQKKGFDFGTYKVQKYLTEIAKKISGDLHLFAGNRIAITAPTGTGKTTLFLENHLNLKGKTLFLVPYLSLLEQIQNDYMNHDNIVIIRCDEKNEVLDMQLYDIGVSDTVKFVVATYDTLPKFENIKFNNVVIDESHELINAYGYRGEVLAAIWEKIQSNCYQLVIFISATTNPLLSNKDFGFDTMTIKREFEYNYTINTLFYKENLVRSLAFYIGTIYQNNKKIVVELNHIEQINKLKTYLNALYPTLTVETINSKAERMEKSNEYLSILNERTIKCDILLCTKFIEAGINISNKDISEVIYVFNQTKNIDSLKQFAGRFRNMFNLPITIFAKKKKEIELKKYYPLESIYDTIISGNTGNCNECNKILSENILEKTVKKELLNEVDKQIVRFGRDKPAKEHERFNVNFSIDNFIDNRNNSLISSCYYYKESIDKYILDYPLALFKAANDFQSSLNTENFINEICKDNEYKKGNILEIKQVSEFENDIENIVELSKEQRKLVTAKIIEFATMNEKEFLELLVRCFRQDKKLLNEYSTICKLDLQSAKNAISQNKDVISYEFFTDNKELLRNTSLLENVTNELIVLRQFASNNKDAFALHNRILANNLNIDSFNDLIAFYTLKTKDFAARNPKLSLQKGHIKYLIEFVEQRNYIVRYKELISDKYLIKYFQSNTQIEKWCKILFIVESKRKGDLNVSTLIFNKRKFNDIDTMKEILGFEL